MLPKTFHIDLPQSLVEDLTNQSPEASTQLPSPGTEWCIRQSEDLIAHGVPAIHYYTMGRTENIQQIVKSVF